MNVAGIIAEYNPFHQGHTFHLAQAKSISEADYTVVAMSGYFVQRGAPAMFDPFTRAEAALLNGADLVLELPPDTSTGSAEYFASGAVSLLEQTGIVTDLCFGSECADLSLLARPAAVLADEPDAYRTCLKEFLKTGIPYPKARTEALHCYDPSLDTTVLAEPNNLLGLEYLKALMRSGSSVRPHTIHRVGAGYHARQITQYASAESLRRTFTEQNGVFTPRVRAQLPSWEVYRAYDQKTPITEDAFSLLLLEKLRRTPGESFSRYFGVTEELSNRILNCLDDFVSFSQFTDLLKTRNLTRTAVSRALTHILLDLHDCRPPRVLRVLGFRKEASVLLKELSARSHLPVVTSPAGTDLPDDWLYADRLYESVRSLLHHTPYPNPRRRKMLAL